MCKDFAEEQRKKKRANLRPPSILHILSYTTVFMKIKQSHNNKDVQIFALFSNMNINQLPSEKHITFAQYEKGWGHNAILRYLRSDNVNQKYTNQTTSVCTTTQHQEHVFWSSLTNNIKRWEDTKGERSTHIQAQINCLCSRTNMLPLKYNYDRK